jgi:hypothetical protein
MDDGDDDVTISAAFAKFDRNMSSGLDLLLAAMPSLTQEQPPPVAEALLFDNLARRADVPEPDEKCSVHSIPGSYVYDGVISIYLEERHRQNGRILLQARA